MSYSKMPDAVQTKYYRTLQDGLPGSNADANPTYDGSFIAVGSDIPYGVVISEIGTPGIPTEGSIGKTNVAATAGYRYGTSNIATLAAMKEITTGSFKIEIDGITVSVTGLSFASATNYAAVATTIQTALRTAANTAGVTSSSSIAVVYVPASDTFKITSGTTGVASVINPMLAASSGTSIVAALGWATTYGETGTAAVTAAALGVVLRSVVDEGGAGSNSNITKVREGQIGAYRMDGTIKVLAQEAVTAGSTVYFDATTGLLFGSNSGTHTTALGSSKWMQNVAAGEVGVIDIRGIR